MLLRLSVALGLSAVWIPSFAPAQAAEAPDLSIAAFWAGDGPAKASVGEMVTYDISLTNLGPGTASGVVVLALTPDQFNPISLTCGDDTFCSEPGGSLGPGATITATVVDVVCCFPKGESRITNAGAAVVSTTADPDLDNNTATVATRIVGPHGFSFPG
jgi:uncharacterized repeat protein (TIGR01451 family)